MSTYKNRHRKQSIQDNDLEQAANELCETALNDAQGQLHPLLQNTELERLDQRNELVQAFKKALEERIARKLASWQPDVQAIFKFDETRMKNSESWDGSIHLLVMVSHLSSTVKALGDMLDQRLLKCLKQLDWSRFQASQSILEVQQVTPNEICRGVSYGAMFYAVYSVPIKVWPQNRWPDESSHRQKN
jgi:hypothetical protein